MNLQVLIHFNTLTCHNIGENISECDETGFLLPNVRVRVPIPLLFAVFRMGQYSWVFLIQVLMRYRQSSHVPL